MTDFDVEIIYFSPLHDQKNAFNELEICSCSQRTKTAS